MNENKSFIKLHRKFLNWEWYKDSNTKDLFIHCLLKANWKDGKFQGTIVPRGSFITSRKNLSKELNITEQSIRTSINRLKSTNEITIKSTNKFTMITVVNYEKYQQVLEMLTNTSTNNTTFEQPTTNQQLTTIEEYKEYKNNKELNNINTSSYAFVENEFGRVLSPVEYETLGDWEKIYGDEKIKLAFREAVLNGVRNFRYTEKILDAWKDLTIDEIKRKPKLTYKNVEVFDYDWLNEED